LTQAGRAGSVSTRGRCGQARTARIASALASIPRRRETDPGRGPSAHPLSADSKLTPCQSSRWLRQDDQGLYGRSSWGGRSRLKRSRGENHGHDLLAHRGAHYRRRPRCRRGWRSCGALNASAAISGVRCSRCSPSCLGALRSQARPTPRPCRYWQYGHLDSQRAVDRGYPAGHPRWGAVGRERNFPPLQDAVRMITPP
jgi:hypothetical protein